MSVQYVVKCSNFFQISIVIGYSFNFPINNKSPILRIVLLQVCRMSARVVRVRVVLRLITTIYMMARDGGSESNGTINTRGVLALAGYSNGHSPPASIKT